MVDTNGPIHAGFTSFGDVVDVDIVRDSTGVPKGFAYVDMMIKDSSFHRCMSVYGNAKWRGMTIAVCAVSIRDMQRRRKHRPTNWPSLSPAQIACILHLRQQASASTITCAYW